MGVVSDRQAPRLSAIISEITAASKEQSQGIEQINQAIVLIDEVTQQNAALVEEAAAAAGSLQDQADKLVETVNVFKLDSRVTVSTSVSETPPLPSLKNDAAIIAMSSTKKINRVVAATPSEKRVANVPLGEEWVAF